MTSSSLRLPSNIRPLDILRGNIFWNSVTVPVRSSFDLFLFEKPGEVGVLISKLLSGFSGGYVAFEFAHLLVHLRGETNGAVVLEEQFSLRRVVHFYSHAIRGGEDNTGMTIRIGANKKRCTCSKRVRLDIRVAHQFLLGCFSRFCYQLHFVFLSTRLLYTGNIPNTIGKYKGVGKMFSKLFQELP